MRISDRAVGNYSRIVCNAHAVFDHASDAVFAGAYVLYLKKLISVSRLSCSRLPYLNRIVIIDPSASQIKPVAVS